MRSSNWLQLLLSSVASTFRLLACLFARMFLQFAHVAFRLIAVTPWAVDFLHCCHYHHSSCHRHVRTHVSTSPSWYGYISAWVPCTLLVRLHAIRVCFLIFGSLKRKLNEKQWYMTYVILLLLYIIVVSSLIKKARIPEKIEKQKKKRKKDKKKKNYVTETNLCLCLCCCSCLVRLL